MLDLTIQEIETKFDAFIDGAMSDIWTVAADAYDADGEPIITDRDTIDDIIDIIDTVNKIRARAIRAARRENESIL